MLLFKTHSLIPRSRFLVYALLLTPIVLFTYGLVAAIWAGILAAASTRFAIQLLVTKESLIVYKLRIFVVSFLVGFSTFAAFL